MRRPHRIDRNKAIAVKVGLGALVIALAAATWFAGRFAWMAPELTRQAVHDAGARAAAEGSAPEPVGAAPIGAAGSGDSTIETAAIERSGEMGFGGSSPSSSEASPPMPPTDRLTLLRERRAAAASRAALESRSLFKSQHTPAMRAPASLALAPVFQQPIVAKPRAPYDRIAPPQSLRRLAPPALLRRPVLTTWIDRRIAEPDAGEIAQRPFAPDLGVDAAIVLVADAETAPKQPQSPALTPSVSTLSLATAPPAALLALDRLAPPSPLTPFARTAAIVAGAPAEPLASIVDREGPDVMVVAAAAVEAAAPTETAQRLQPRQTPARAVTTTGVEAARIVIQFAGSRQLGGADAVAEGLADRGFERVQFSEVPVGVLQAEIRYFHASDAVAANVVQDIAGSIGATAIIRDFTSYRPSPSLGTIELWLPRRRG